MQIEKGSSYRVLFPLWLVFPKMDSWNMNDFMGQLHAFEFKWNERKANVKCPESFSTAYPEATFQVITPKNIEEFLMV